MLERAQFTVTGTMVTRSRGVAAALATADADLDYHRRLDAAEDFDSGPRVRAASVDNAARR